MADSTKMSASSAAVVSAAAGAAVKDDDDSSAGSDSPPPAVKKHKSRAYIELPAYDIDESKTLTSLLTFIQSLKSVELTDSEAKKAAGTTDLNPRAVVVCISKYMHFENESVATCDELKLSTEVRNMDKVTRFMNKLRKAEFTHSAIIKYLHALSVAVEYILQLNLPIDERMSMEQTKCWFKNIKKPRSRAVRKETRKRNSREAMMADNTWIDASQLNTIQNAVNQQADAMVTKFRASGAVTTDADAVQFRHLVVFTLYATGKICRRMVYYSMDLSVWKQLPRDKEKRKFMSTDTFKTAATYGLDTIIFPVDIEARIDEYIKYCRPVLAKASSSAAAAAVTDNDALWLTKSGTRHLRLHADIISVCKKYANGVHVSITTLRKVLATEVATFGTVEQQKLLGKNDTHNDATVRTYYEKKLSYDTAASGLVTQKEVLAKAAERVYSGLPMPEPVPVVAPPPAVMPPLPPIPEAPKPVQYMAAPNHIAVVAPPPYMPPLPPLPPAPPPPAPTQLRALPPPVPPAAVPPPPRAPQQHQWMSPPVPPAAVPATVAPAPPAVAPAATARPTGAFTPEMDAILKEAGARATEDAIPVAWAALKRDRSDVFFAVTSEQMRWRWKNLMKATPSVSSRPVHKRKYTPPAAAAASVTAAVAETFVPTPPPVPPPAASAQMIPPHQHYTPQRYWPPYEEPYYHHHPADRAMCGQPSYPPPPQYRPPYYPHN